MPKSYLVSRSCDAVISWKQKYRKNLLCLSKALKMLIPSSIELRGLSPIVIFQQFCRGLAPLFLLSNIAKMANEDYEIGSTGEILVTCSQILVTCSQILVTFSQILVTFSQILVTCSQSSIPQEKLLHS